ncbi:MAG: diphthamide biosynthesis enzyme Dph2 [Candidatus Bathyarchaeia archaeon]
MSVPELERVVGEIARRKAHRVLLQLPDGLKRLGPGLANEIEDSTDATVIISGGHCYGACDLALGEAMALGVDLILHYGHTPWSYETTIPALFLEARAELDLRPSVREAISLLEGVRAVGLAATVQFVSQLGEVKELLERQGKRVYMGKGRGELPYDGQITGCNYATSVSVAKKVDAFLVVGGGTFHALGLALMLDKRVVAVDPYTGRSTDVGDLRKRVLMQRWGLISKAREYRTFGVIVGSMPGQEKFQEAVKIQNKLRRHEKTSVMISLQNITEEALLPFENIDAFVDTACPRVAIDDLASFSKPILLPGEVDVILGEATWNAKKPLRVNDSFWLALPSQWVR